MSIFFVALACVKTDVKIDIRKNLNSNHLLKFIEEEYDFGNVNVSEKEVSKDFVFQNRSDEQIIISYVETSCNCIINSWPSKPLDSKQVDTINVVYNTYHKAHFFSKSIYVYHSGDNSPMELKIKGHIIDY